MFLLVNSFLLQSQVKNDIFRNVLFCISCVNKVFQMWKRCVFPCKMAYEIFIRVTLTSLSTGGRKFTFNCSHKIWSKESWCSLNSEWVNPYCFGTIRQVCTVFIRSLMRPGPPPTSKIFNSEITAKWNPFQLLQSNPLQLLRQLQQSPMWHMLL